MTKKILILVLFLVACQAQEKKLECVYTCPKNSRPISSTECPKGPRHCECKGGFKKLGGICECNQKCPRNAFKLPGVKCPVRFRSECACRKKYKWDGRKCVKVDPYGKSKDEEKRKSGKRKKDEEEKKGKANDEDEEKRKDGDKEVVIELGPMQALWLDEHNNRRKRYHRKYGYKYLPMVWSRHLEKSAQTWANELAKNYCSEFYHDPNSHQGENLAYTYSTDPTQAIHDAMIMWVENEELGEKEKFTWYHGHMTQVLWRATRHVGCAHAMGQREGCTFLVCRYLRPGNCNLDEDNWLKSTMAETSPCAPICPPYGEQCIS